MRPEQLTPLFAAAKSLAGIGPRMEILLKKALRLPPGVGEPTGDRPALAHARGRHRPPRHAHRHGGRARHHRHAGGARPQAQAGAARQQPGALQGDLRGRQRPHRPRLLPRRPQVRGAPAARGEHPHHQRPHRKLQRQEADDASRLHRRARGARRSAPARAGLSAHRRALRQGAAEGRPPGAGAGARFARVAGRGLARAARLARCEDGADAPAPARGGGGRISGLAALAAACLRRAAGGPAGAGPGAAEPQVPARPPGLGRRRRPRPHRRRAALRPHQLAAPGPEGDRRGHGRAAPHAAPAAGRRRLRQDGGGADGHGGRGGGGCPGRPDGADRGAGAPACRHHRALRRGRRPAPGPADGPGEGPPARRTARAAGGRRGRHPRRHARAVPGRRAVQGPGLRRHRRAAPLRRAPAPRPAVQGRPGPQGAAPACW